MTIPTGADGYPVDMTAADVTYGSATVVGSLAVVTPTLPLIELSEDELDLVNRLTERIMQQRYTMELHDSYYRGTERVADLGISIPPQMRGLRTVLGWPRVAIDSLDARLNVEGFRFPTSVDVDEDLLSIWQANDLDSESQLAHIDALVFGRSYVAVGSGNCGAGAADCPPLITVESPLDIGVEWDARSRTVLAALRLYGFEGSRQATLYTPEQTVSLLQTHAGWDVIDRDQHNLRAVPVVRIANHARSYDRDGSSEITPELMSVTDEACRTLQSLAVAREFYSAPQRYILGASEAAFQDANGNPLDAWQTYLGRVLALERDEDGNAPTVGQFTPYDPSVYTKVIDMYARIVSSMTSLPPHVLGYTTDNPASADAIRSTEMALKLKADRKTRMFGAGWRDVMKLALLIRDGDLPSDAHQITAVWANTATPTPAATTDAIFKQVQAGILPAGSDVTLEELGYSAVQRLRIEADRKTDQAAQFLAQIGTSLVAREASADRRLAGDLTAPIKTATPTTSPPAPPAPPSGNG